MIDLHMHTNISDGTDPPEEMCSRMKNAGVTLFSVTDHDAIAGCERIAAAREKEDPAFVFGVEFSCKDEEGKYHILGYGYDAGTEPIRKVVKHGHALRMYKLEARLAFLKEHFGFTFPENEIRELKALSNPGKPHIGNLMVRHGYAQSRGEAIKKYLNQLQMKTEYIRPEEAISGILGSGGIPVLAHPTFGDGDQLIMGEEMDVRIRKLMAFGLKGLEGFYSGFTEPIRAEILAFAEKYGLYVTAGSDYHGTNKMIEIGDTGLEIAQGMPEGLRRFLADVRRLE